MRFFIAAYGVIAALTSTAFAQDMPARMPDIATTGRGEISRTLGRLISMSTGIGNPVYPRLGSEVVVTGLASSGFPENLDQAG
jgi:hypothetical protein